MTDVDLTSLVDAVAADLWNGSMAGSSMPWDQVPAMHRHQVRETILPTVTATVKHLKAQRPDSADREIARLHVELSERLGEPVDPRIRAIAEGTDDTT